MSVKRKLALTVPLSAAPDKDMADAGSVTASGACFNLLVYSVYYTSFYIYDL